MFSSGVLASHDLGVPVISVGNITVGGTGKTPLVAFVAKILAENNRKVCILTRGYKRENSNERVIVSDGKTVLADARQSGDEPFELAQKLIGVSAVVADKDRASAGKWTKENLGIDAFVLDDGFQHLKLKRTIDIVTIDATNPFGNGWLLPEGTLREPVSALGRAHAIIITRSDLAKNLDELKTKLAKIAPGVPVFTSRNRTSRVAPLQNLFSQNENDDALVSKKVFAFCALGNPLGFFGQLKNEGLEIVATETFKDHHAYTQQDISALEEKARSANARALLTTVKDAVKLKGVDFSMPCYVAISEIVFDDEDALRQIILSALSN